MRSNTFIPRTWIIFLQIFGTIFSVAGLITYIFYMGQLSDVISADQVVGKVSVGIILSVLFYFTWKSIYTCVVIIQYMQVASDSDISNNRFILSALSLNLGGIVTPFILTALPNIDVQSTINPRLFLSKVMGIISLVGAAIGLIILFTSVSTGTGALTSKQLFDGSTKAGIMTIISLTVYLLVLSFGIITTGLFYGTKKIDNGLETKSATYSSALKAISSIWMGILTVELVITIVFAFIRLLGVIEDLFRVMGQNKNFMGLFYVLLSLANLFITLLYTFWVIKVTVATIAGLWDDQGIHYKEYDELNKRRKSATNNK